MSICMGSRRAIWGVERLHGLQLARGSLCSCTQIYSPVVEPRGSAPDATRELSAMLHFSFQSLLLTPFTMSRQDAIVIDEDEGTEATESQIINEVSSTTH